MPKNSIEAMSGEFTDDQIIQGIASAIGERKFEIVADLMRVLAVQNPQAAQNVLDVINSSGAFLIEPAILPVGGAVT